KQLEAGLGQRDQLPAVRISGGEWVQVQRTAPRHSKVPAVKAGQVSVSSRRRTRRRQEQEEHEPEQGCDENLAHHSSPSGGGSSSSAEAASFDISSSFGPPPPPPPPPRPLRAWPVAGPART